jgi:hypothetical protein
MTPAEPALELWLDLAIAVAQPARIVDIEHSAVLIQTEPPAGAGAPLLLLKNGSEITTLAVSDPHEPSLRAVTFAYGNILLCGDVTCRVYGIVENGLRLLDEPEAPMAEDAIEGSFAIGDYWTSSTAPVAFCVHGDGIVCLENGSWTELAAPGDALLTAGSNSPTEHVVAGENGRMGKLSRWPDVEAAPVWTELERLTDLPLRAASSWFTAGDDGTLITLGTKEATLCNTGGQDWEIHAAGLQSSAGDVLYFSDPEVEMRGPCLRTAPSGVSYVARTDYQEGTTWGVAVATETQVFRKMTGATE